MERFKKTLAWIGLVGIMLSSTMVAQALSFTDVSESDWYYEYVSDLVDADIVDDGATFRPADPLNRAEVAKIAVLAAGLDLDSSDGPTFEDVAADAWYYDYVETAAKYGIVAGDTDAEGNLTGTYRPGDNVNRAEATKILGNAMDLVENVEGGPHFPDVAEDAWYYSYVETAYNWSVVDGNPDGTFKPGDPIARAA
ncbi:MAG: S-layer homology domain-containing protein, partial [Patescibacteria group bacterium]